jgi:opacity protein-like surface antigen
MVQGPAGDWQVGDPNQGANRTALSLGVNYALTANAVVKAEYRYDRASQAVFQVLPDGNWRKDNQLFGTAVVVSF